VKNAGLGEGSAAVPAFASYTLVFVLKLRKNDGKTSLKLTEDTWLISAENLAMAGDGLDWPAGPCRLGFRVKPRGQLPVSVSADLPYYGILHVS
jgi:hypothetical protein